ncbi:hypothetical protein HDF14_001233 [Edaphobacter lichenicola]|jgi:hypothetical protein|uniref:Uncharacterized protein n=1 Tax=Tunturiibacter gelidiferens TaxID=3069689 RepID=A0A9X0QC99_9BACT|nr:hypothetical protein [Edaphobacter lichenicola]
MGPKIRYTATHNSGKQALISSRHFGAFKLQSIAFFWYLYGKQILVTVVPALGMLA